MSDNVQPFGPPTLAPPAPALASPARINLAELGKSLGREVETILRDTLEDGLKSQAGLGTFSRMIAIGLVHSIEARNSELTAEARDQLRLLAHIAEVRLTPMAWATLERVLGVVLRVVVTTVVSMV